MLEKKPFTAWEGMVIENHKSHSKMPRDEAMMEYLKTAQTLEMYGRTYYGQ